MKLFLAELKWAASPNNKSYSKNHGGANKDIAQYFTTFHHNTILALSIVYFATV